jgi:hypothetical protein
VKPGLGPISSSTTEASWRRTVMIVWTEVANRDRTIEVYGPRDADIELESENTNSRRSKDIDHNAAAINISGKGYGRYGE